jgi:hypothetical protein
MNTQRFNYERGASGASRSKPREFPKWIRATHLGGRVLRDSGKSGRTRIFAIVAPPKVDPSGKAIRRILIFDNHPESLRLVSEQYLTSVVDATASRRTTQSYVILGLALGLILAIGMTWLLLQPWSLTPLVFSAKGAVTYPSVATPQVSGRASRQR